MKPEESQSQKDSMTPENQISSNELPTFLNVLKPRLVGDVWIYEPEGREMFTLNEGRVRASTIGVKELSPKTSFWNRILIGWSLQVRTDKERRERFVLASCGIGKNPADLFKNVFIIDQKLGGVVALSSPGREILSLLKLDDDNQPVFIPVSSTRKREGGILVVSNGDLRKPQNKGRIEGFLKV